MQLKTKLQVLIVKTTIDSPPINNGLFYILNCGLAHNLLLVDNSGAHWC